jgi:xanthine/uracil permease
LKDKLLDAQNWVAGLQWFFFIFANIVVIPITVGAAFELEQDTVVTMLQFSFIITGLACMAQAFLGHGRAIMEGQSGLWWGIILTLVVTATAQDMPLKVLGGSLAIGVFISAVLTVIIGLAGLGPYIAKLFSPGVMGVFMFLFGVQLINIFLKGMFGLPFGNESDSASIDMSIASLAIVIAAVVIVFNIKAPAKIRSYGLLLGIVVGWIAYALIFGSDKGAGSAGLQFDFFPLGTPVWNTGVIITAVITGLLNTANTFGALKGTDRMYDDTTSKKQYRYSFTITGIFAGIAGLFGLVPYAPFVSSIGFLKQTGILRKLPFLIGGFLFFLIGLIPPVGQFFSTLPLSIGSAVLFVAYLQLLNSSWEFFGQIKLNTLNVYRSAIPMFVGIIVMTLPPSAFESIPAEIRPVVSNGLLVGIILALIFENALSWDRIGGEKRKRDSA